MKLCVDCRHYGYGNFPDRCGEPRNRIPDYVHGADPRIIYGSAQGVRVDTTMCAPDGKWFEQKVPAWDDLPDFDPDRQL